MKKKVIVRSLQGFPLGVFIGYSITVIISCVWGGGGYLPVQPVLIAQTGSEMNAVLLQYLLCGLLGAASGGSSAIWENDTWSLLKRAVIHFTCLTIAMFPVAWFMWWMPHTAGGVLIYFGLFIGIYAVIFAGQYIYWKNTVKDLDEAIKKNKFS